MEHHVQMSRGRENYGAFVQLKYGLCDWIIRTGEKSL